MSGTYEGLRMASHAQNEPDQPCPEDDEENEAKSKKGKSKDKEMTEKTLTEADVAKAAASAAADANTRFMTVLGSEHYAGREAAAAKLLGNDKLSADDIVGLLADLPKAAAPNANDAPTKPEANADDAAFRDAVVKALAGSNVESLGASGAGGAPDKAKISAGWKNGFDRTSI